MYIILGATGHVGSAVAGALLAAGEAVTVVTRDADKAAGWRARGAEAAVIDIADTDALRALFRTGRRAFLLNPPAPPTADTDRAEHESLARIVAALAGSGLEKIVAQSTYGAQPGDRIGDLSVLHDFEVALARQPIPLTVQRAAYYMTNWDGVLEPARAGTLPTMFPADLPIPMVAPADLGAAAARSLREPIARTGLRFVEGPARYTAREVAAAFARALGRDVTLEVIPPDGWQAAFARLGFSDEAAFAYARMTGASVDAIRAGDLPDAPERGDVTLQAYVDRLVAHPEDRG